MINFCPVNVAFLYYLSLYALCVYIPKKIRNFALLFVLF